MLILGTENIVEETHKMLQQDEVKETLNSHLTALPELRPLLVNLSLMVIHFILLISSLEDHTEINSMVMDTTQSSLVTLRVMLTVQCLILLKTNTNTECQVNITNKAKNKHPQHQEIRNQEAKLLALKENNQAHLKENQVLLMHPPMQEVQQTAQEYHQAWKVTFNKETLRIHLPQTFTQEWSTILLL